MTIRSGRLKRRWQIAAGHRLRCGRHRCACRGDSEKQAMAWMVDGRASLVVGTHTHVPTADTRIMPGGTAYMSDAGMCGDYDSVLGMDKAEPLRRFLEKTPGSRFEAASGPGTLAASLWKLMTGRGLRCVSAQCGRGRIWSRPARLVGLMAPVARRAICGAALFAMLPWRPARAQQSDHSRFAAEAARMRAQAMPQGDQPYGAVLVLDDAIVGYGPSRVVAIGTAMPMRRARGALAAQQALGRHDARRCGHLCNVGAVRGMPAGVGTAARVAAWMRVGPAADDRGAPRADF